MEGGTGHRRLLPEVGSRRLLDEDRQTVLVAGKPAGWGCTGQPFRAKRCSSLPFPYASRVT